MNQNKFNFLKNIFKEGSTNIYRWPDCATPMIEEINALKPTKVVDLGCGSNAYKGMINNLTGIDFATPEADISCTIEDLPFEDNSVDVCLALGSINFGNEELIRKQLSEAKRITKSGGYLYFRVMCEHNNELYYPWNLQKAKQFAKEFDLEFVDGPRTIYKTIWEDTREKQVGDRGKERLYWVWKV